MNTVVGKIYLWNYTCSCLVHGKLLLCKCVQIFPANTLIFDPLTKMSIDQLRLILLSFVLCLVNAKGEVFHERCPRFHIKKTTIIKTQQSIHNGAEFLGKKVVSSSRGCHEKCCKTGGCNLVMLKYEVKENAQKVSCFMFNCRSPSVCTFFQHSTYHGYAALEYEDRKSSFSNKNSAFKGILCTPVLFAECIHLIK